MAKLKGFVSVKVEQAGGNYGEFQCPVCLGVVDYKFNASSGWCNDCKATFYLTDKSADLYLVSEDWRSTHWMQLEIQYGKMDPEDLTLEGILGHFFT